jgi:hypothetical protein
MRQYVVDAFTKCFIPYHSFPVIKFKTLLKPEEINIKIDFLRFFIDINV